MSLSPTGWIRSGMRHVGHHAKQGILATERRPCIHKGVILSRMAMEQSEENVGVTTKTLPILQSTRVHRHAGTWTVAKNSLCVQIITCHDKMPFQSNTGRTLLQGKGNPHGVPVLRLWPLGHTLLGIHPPPSRQLHEIGEQYFLKLFLALMMKRPSEQQTTPTKTMGRRNDTTEHWLLE